jgi:hypothetical protein
MLVQRHAIGVARGQDVRHHCRQGRDREDGRQGALEDDGIDVEYGKPTIAGENGVVRGDMPPGGPPQRTVRLHDAAQAQEATAGTGQRPIGVRRKCKRREPNPGYSGDHGSGVMLGTGWIAVRP